MKKYILVSSFAMLIFVMLFALLNYGIIQGRGSIGGDYRVEIERASFMISEGKEPDISKFQYITSVTETDKSEAENDFFDVNQFYAVREINGRLYRFDCKIQTDFDKTFIIEVNVVTALAAISVMLILIHIGRNVLKPFSILKDMPYELSKGNLTIPLKENKNRYFGKFVWGMELLRDKLEKQHKDELELQKEKKTLILTISHDIKTPLSAIKLYSKALSKGLYSQKEKQLEISEKINEKADEIESFVSQIVKASNEDFLHLEVKISEFYLSEAVESIREYYTDKLKLNYTSFVIEKYSNCLIKGDSERSAEVLQNIIENAVKYGDGKEIKISFSEEEGCILVCISNSGCTLSEHELPHVFESFWRGSNSSSENGSGLGLYICRVIMNKMDGEVFADISENNMLVTAVFRKA